MTPARYAEVLALLEDYCDGLYDLDVQKLERAFSPTARYATIVDGSLTELSVEEYLPRLPLRTPPAEDGTPREFRVLSVRFGGEHLAHAEVQCSLFGHDYTDFLSLLRVDGRWRIQSKVFEGVPVAQEVR